jgi:hypothetical protein
VSYFKLSSSYRAFYIANKGGMELSFDDSWMEEVPGQEFARFGEYKDDQVRRITIISSSP